MMGRKRRIPLWSLASLPIGAVLISYAISHPAAVVSLGLKTTGVDARLAQEAARFKGVINPLTQAPYDTKAIERRLHRIREQLIQDGTKPVYYGG